ncbi:cell wall-binding repeat-containing protein [Lagierella sp.]|uniref:cell wall-binding repeat-containing protein n=1 Tax=Lagierella sp. TaxID=2849657 RepID=UPI00260BD9AE|nr:cell wall-binding repeat-containing protein [Lagierella sp.]
MKKKILSILLAGALLVPGSRALASENFSVERIYGDNRYETATKISQKLYSKPKAVVVASGEVFPDALVGSTLTIQEKWPLLLTNAKTLNEKTKDELKRLDPEKVYVLGGSSTISLDVERELSKLYPTERIYGKDRYLTAEKIGDLRYKLLDREVSKDKVTNFIVSGKDYPDALSSGPLAGRTKDDEGFNRLNLSSNSKGFDNPIIIGGKSSVIGDSRRIKGKDRYLTSLEVAKEYKKTFGNLDTVILASGEDYPDALSASSASAVLDAPILLTKSNNINPDLLSFIKENVKKVVVIGGNTSVTESNILDILYGKDSNFRYALGKLPDDLKSNVTYRKVLSGNEKADILDLFLEANELTELPRVISKEKAIEVLGLDSNGDYDLEVLKRAAAFKVGSNVDVEYLKTFVTSDNLKPLIDKIALGSEFHQSKNAVKSGKISDPYLAFKFKEELKSAEVVTGNKIFKAGVELITSDKTTGFNIVSDKYKTDLDKEKTLVYSHDDIVHTNQLLAILRLEGIDGKVSLEPKSSAFEYRLEWGPIPEPTKQYEVVKVKEDKYIANAVEFNTHIEFEKIEDKLSFDSIVKKYAQKTTEDPNGEKVIFGSWWQPLYSSETEMKEGYGPLVDNTVSVENLTLHSFTTKEKSENLIKTLNEFLELDSAKANDIWVNDAFIRYLQGESN